MEPRTQDFDMQTGHPSALAKVRESLSSVGTGILRYSLVFFLLMFGVMTDGWPLMIILPTLAVAGTPARVVGGVELEGAVVIEVGKDGATRARKGLDRGHIHALEAPVAEIAKEAIGDGARSGGVVGIGPVAGIADEDVDQAVTIEVAPRAAVAEEAGERFDEAGSLGGVFEADGEGVGGVGCGEGDKREREQ